MKNNFEEEEQIDDSDRLKIELKEEKSKIDSLISKIDEKQLEISTMVDNLKIRINQLDKQRTFLMSQKPVDFKHVNYLDKLIYDNYLLVNSFYNTHKEYEGVKSRYIKDRNEHNLRMNNFLLIQLTKLDESSDSFKDMFRAMIKISENKNFIDYDEGLNIESSPELEI